MLLVFVFVIWYIRIRHEGKHMNDRRKTTRAEKKCRKSSQGLKLTMDRVIRILGRGSVMMMNERGYRNRSYFYRFYKLDVAWVWRFAKGRVVEIYGPKSSGKTT
jgi:RecA/RadA recombinase